MLHNITGMVSRLLQSGAESSRVMNSGRLGDRTVTATQAKAPPKIERLCSDEPQLLSRLSKSSLPSTRSIHTLFALQQNRIDAAALAIKNLGGDPSGLKHLSRQLEAALFKEDRPATKHELTQSKSLDKDLQMFIAKQLQQLGVPAKEANNEAKVAMKLASQDVLNNKVWDKVETVFAHKGEQYACSLVPAAQMKRGGNDIFPVSYREHGVCCSSTKNATHATNLWTSEIRAKDNEGKDVLLFKGVRHGILSPYGLEKGSVERENGAMNRAREAVTAALFARPDLLEKALAGQEVPLRIVSSSLVTGGLWNEKDMLDDQVNAWKSLSQEQPLTLSVMGDDGKTQDVRIKLEVAAFNFGVNELALKFHLGQRQSDGYNEVALHQLLGQDLSVGTQPGGWVGEYLARVPAPDNAGRVQLLSRQLQGIWADKSHNRDGGEPYKAAQRAAMLAYEIGAVPCWNCKSGKDRTGMLDAEIKREVVTLHQQKALSIPGSPLTKDDQALLQQILLRGGNAEIQAYNTGAPGNKVMKDLPAMNLSYHHRLGNDDVWMQAQGLSGLVKA